MTFRIAYFSATGNSFDAATIVHQELTTAGCTATLEDMCLALPPGGKARGYSPKAHLGASEYWVFVFPVYAWAPPALVLRSLRRLPRRPKRLQSKAAVLAVDGGGGLRAAECARRVLRRRRVDVTVTARAGYPDNWAQMLQPPAEPDAERQRAAGREAARAFAGDIVGGRRRYYSPRTFGAWIGAAVGGVFRLYGRRHLGQLFAADHRCTSCRLCERTCPVGAIHIAKRRGAHPYWNARCESCNRCINVCPEQAIVTSPARIVAVTGAIIGLVFAGLQLLQRLVWPRFGSVPPLVYAAGVVAVVIAAAVLYFPIGKPFVRALHAIPGIRHAMNWGFNRNWRRYRAPGFTPNGSTCVSSRATSMLNRT